MSEKHNIHLGNFDMASLRVIWFCWARFWVAGASKRGEPRAPVNGKESRSAEFSTVRSTVGQDFDEKLCNSAERTAKAKRELPSISNDMQSSETLRNSLGLNYKSAAVNQPSYAGACPYENRFSEFIKNSCDDLTA